MAWVEDRKGHFVEKMEFRPLRDLGHPEARLLELVSVEVPDLLLQEGVPYHRDPQGQGHAFHRDIVVGGAQPARGEDVVETASKEIECLPDDLLFIRDDDGSRQPDPEFPQGLSEVVEVRILNAARQEFVPDSHIGGGDFLFCAHGNRLQ